MRAAVLKKLNKPLSIQEVDLPGTLEYGQVLVRIHAAGICGAQLREISGAKGPDPYLPHLLGHEGAGVVREVGPGVTRVQPGDRVVLHWRKAAGIDAAPPKYHGGAIGAGPVATFCERAVVAENRCTPMDDAIPFHVAALLGCAVTTAIGVVDREAKLLTGESIAVAGCGGVGLAIIQAAHARAAQPILAIDTWAGKLQRAGDLGASVGINTALDKRRKLRDLVDYYTGGAGVDVFVDTTGACTIIRDGYDCLTPGGRMILVGQPSRGHDLWMPNFQQHYTGKTMLDSQGGLCNPGVDIPRYLRLYAHGRVDFSKLITHCMPLADINTAIALVRDTEEVGRCILEM